jgi:hypothetical protein
MGFAAEASHFRQQTVQRRPPAAASTRAAFHGDKV